MNKHRTRRFFYLKDTIQKKLLINHFLFFAGGLLLFIFIFVNFSQFISSFSLESVNIAKHHQPGFYRWFLFFLPAIFFFLYFALHSSHRIAGPLYSIERKIEQMGQGNLTTRLTLRKGDEGKSLAQKVNSLNEMLEQKVTTATKHSSIIADLLSQKKHAGEHNLRHDELLLALKIVEKHNNAIQEQLKAFTLK